MKTSRNDRVDPRYATASVNPLTLRYLALTVRERGYEPSLICRGLGFDVASLEDPTFKISYRQASLMIKRAQQLVGGGGLGLAVGSRLSIVSWGLVGFAMLSCATLREATDLGVRFQKEAGSLARISRSLHDRDLVIVFDRLFDDPDIEVFLIEEMLASMLRVTRYLVGPQYAPKSLELVYAAPAHASLYGAIFQCPIRFGGERNRFISDASWADYRLPTHDPFVALASQNWIVENLQREREKADLGDTIERAIRDNLANPPPLRKIAVKINVSERTLRRRLSSAGFSYQALLESVRKSKALELLTHTPLSVTEVAEQTGFTDVRNFRRAFKRWTGVAPSDLRDPAEVATRRKARI